MNVVGECENGKEAIEFLKNNSLPNIILMDINMPEMNGIDATRIITNKYPNINVLALTMHAEPEYILNMVKSGAMGYILKDSSTEELITAINMVSDSEKYYSNQVSIAMISSLVDNKPKSSNNSSKLSDREKEVLSLIAKGSTNTEIGKELSLARRTIETHRRNILTKLNLRNTAELIKHAIENT